MPRSCGSLPSKLMIILVPLSVLVLSACSSVRAEDAAPAGGEVASVAASPVPAATATAQQPKQIGQSDTPAAEPEATEAGLSATLSPASPTAEIPAASPTELAPTPIVFVPSDRTGLVSTDPATFNLASGQLQLVEFMAFW